MRTISEERLLRQEKVEVVTSAQALRQDILTDQESIRELGTWDAHFLFFWTLTFLGPVQVL